MRTTTLALGFFFAAAACGGREFTMAAALAPDASETGDTAGGDAVADDGNASGSDAPFSGIDAQHHDGPASGKGDASPAADADASPASSDGAPDAGPSGDGDAEREPDRGVDAPADGPPFDASGSPCGALNYCPPPLLCYSGVCR